MDARPIGAIRVAVMVPLNDGRTRLSGKYDGVTYDVVVTDAFVRKHRPHLGGYVTRDPNGYLGFKPAVEFEQQFQKTA